MLDASIFQRFQRKSPLDFEQERNALETSKLNRELNKQRVEENQLALATKKRDQEEGNRLQELQRGMSGVDPKEYASRYRQAGFFKQADEADKTLLSLEKDTTDIAEKKAKISKEDFDLIKEKTKFAGNGWGFVRNNPTPQAAERMLSTLEANNIYSPEKVQKIRDEIAKRPGEIAKIAEEAYTFSLEAKDQLEKYETRNLGGTSRVESINPVTGKRTTVSEDKITEGEAERLRREQSARDSAAGRAVSMRGQNMSDARAREAGNIQKDAARSQVIQTDEGFSLVDKGTGKVTSLTDASGKPLSPKLKDAPPAVQRAMIENGANLRRAESALRLVSGENVGEAAGDKSATGLKGYLPNQVLNRVDPKGVDARAAIADLGSLVIHERSGAAVTAAEFPRLAPFIPTEKDDAPTVKKKLKRFVQVYKDEMSAAQSAYGPDSGYRQLGKSPSAPGANRVKFDAQGNVVP